MDEVNNTGAQQPESEKSLKEEFAQAEAELTDEEKELFKKRKEEITARWLITGAILGALIGALIGQYLLDAGWVSGLYTGLPVGLLFGLGAGQIFGGLEKALMLEHIGKYARPQAAESKPDTQLKENTGA